MDRLDVVLDIGNGYIKGIIVGEDNGKKILLVKESVKTKGMRKGRVLDTTDLAKSIGSIISSFEKKLGEGFIDEITIGISHPSMLIKRVAEQKRILNKEVGHEDVEHLHKVVEEFGGEPNYEIIKILPVTWIVDEDIKIKDPIGMEGDKLELIADMFMIPKNFLNNLYEIFDNLGIGISDIVPNILGASEVSLDIDSKDLGVCLIDIGTNQTSYVVYEEGIPLYYGVIPYGGEDVTKDISIGLQVDISEAEKIKREYGIAINESEYFPNDDMDIKLISEIIAARYEEIFEKVNKGLIDLEREGKLAGGIILIGGGAKTRNLDKLAKELFKLAVFYGKDKVMKFGEISNNLQFVNVIGAYVWKDKYGDYGSSSFNISLDIKGLYTKIVNFIKNLF